MRLFAFGASRVATITHLSVLACALLLLSSTIVGQHAERRLALVVGNNGYPQALLKNAQNDAAALARALTRLGFSSVTQSGSLDSRGVVPALDVTRESLTRALATFADALRNTDIAVFYFAGHGVQVDNQNYLLPIDFAGSGAQLISLSGINASAVEKQLRTARVGIVILDACRTNAFAGTRQIGSSLIPVSPTGTMTVLAAAPGQNAEDSPTQPNGVFMTALLQEIEKPDVDINMMFNNVKNRVYRATSGRQRPSVINDIFLDQFVLRPGGARTTPPAEVERRPVGPPPSEPERSPAAETAKASPGSTRPQPAASDARPEKAREPGLVTRGTSGADGRFSLSVPPGTYTVRVTLDGFVGVEYTGARVSSTERSAALASPGGCLNVRGGDTESPGRRSRRHGGRSRDRPTRRHRARRDDLRVPGIAEDCAWIRLRLTGARAVGWRSAQ